MLWLTGQDCLEGQKTLLPRDPELEEWGQILHAWYACLGEQRRTVPMLLHEIETTIAQEKEHGRDTDQALLGQWQTLQQLLANVDPRGDGTRINGRMLGKLCARYRGRMLGEYRLLDVGDYQHARQWQIERSVRR